MNRLHCTRDGFIVSASDISFWVQGCTYREIDAAPIRIVRTYSTFY